MAQKLFQKNLLNDQKILYNMLLYNPKCFLLQEIVFHFEYTNCSGDYLKFELYEDDKLTKFIVRKDGTLDFRAKMVLKQLIASIILMKF